MDDKTKIRLLKALLGASVASHIYWIKAGMKLEKNLQTIGKIAKIQQKAVAGFIRECEERQEIELLGAVMEDIKFDVITMDLDL